ncbi:hypothetical protein MC885_021653 [Smutsia gigantea]|nr:hypothetical protein MC885_021653 [Smutsia gigantea]
MPERLTRQRGGPASSVDISRKPRRRTKTRSAHARQQGPGILLRHQPPPGLHAARLHARTLVLRPRAPSPTLFSPLWPEEALSARCTVGAQVESAAAVARGKREEAVTAEKAPESSPERSRLPRSCRRRGPPTRSPVPLPGLRCSLLLQSGMIEGTMSSLNFVLKTVRMLICLGGSDNFKHLNEIDLFHCIDPNDSKHKRTDRSILCCLRKGESGQSWPRLTKERAKLNWLSVDFNNWKDWEDDSDEDMSNFDRFSEMMNNMGGDEDVDLPEVDGADDDSQDSDDESKCLCRKYIYTVMFHIKDQTLKIEKLTFLQFLEGKLFLYGP